MVKDFVKTPVATAALLAAVLAVLPAAAQQKDQTAADKDALAQNFLAEHEIGRRYHIDPNDLPRRRPGRSSPTGR